MIILGDETDLIGLFSGSLQGRLQTKKIVELLKY